MAQYRKPIDFTDEALTAATNGWHTLREGLLFGHQHGQELGWDTSSAVETSRFERFVEAVNDDFNFPGGLAIIFELAKDLVREGNILVHEGKTKTPATELFQQWHTLVTLAGVFGLEAKNPADITADHGLSDAEIEDLIQQRQTARKAKNFTEGDRIRDQLLAQGITLIDSREGTRWHRS